MARRISVELVALALFATLSANAGVIASYSFDDDALATGPDTFAIFEHAKGRVDLVSDIRHSGYNSVRITDVAGDGDFPEVQGYFEKVEKGSLHFRFAMLVATPRETLNIALAGPQHFTMEKDGIAFWLKSNDGFLCHVTDGIPKKLFAIEPFVWYVIDAVLDIDAGTYDLTIHREGRNTPIIALTKQPNATNSAHSSLWMFSFVGSVFEDDSNVRYYIDDVDLASSDSPNAPPFVAPGRRELFIDRWRDMQKAASTHKDCPPILEVGDVTTLSSRAAQQQSRCEEIVALTRVDRWAEAEERWSSLAPLFHDDLRYGYIAALLGSHRENWDEAEAWLRPPAESMRNIEQPREQKLIAEEYYFVLLWRGENERASKYAERVAQRLDSAWWRERAGDALLLANQPNEARRFYDEKTWSGAERLADIAYLLHDFERERKLRETLYGSLHR